MNAQGLIQESRLVHVRELKTALARLRAENSRLQAENEMLRAHFELAVLAVRDLEALGQSGRLVIFDGWNLILGADRLAGSREELLAMARRHLADHPCDLVWIVYDGPRENTVVEPRLRISYTGGTGPHRADRFICDFLRMARFAGTIDRIDVKTCDRDFLSEVRRLKGD